MNVTGLAMPRLFLPSHIASNPISTTSGLNQATAQNSYKQSKSTIILNSVSAYSKPQKTWRTVGTGTVMLGIALGVGVARVSIRVAVQGCGQGAGATTVGGTTAVGGRVSSSFGNFAMPEGYMQEVKGLAGKTEEDI
ncbi:hypothetical protein EDC04DRAFT_2603379 [Pisolithus marmoratus]|nr:hypothetical protein EDC04DRAFT_2603379 [Pisolithus marmoratus]